MDLSKLSSSFPEHAPWTAFKVTWLSVKTEPGEEGPPKAVEPAPPGTGTRAPIGQTLPEAPPRRGHVVTGTTWWALTSHFPGNNRHSCFPWSSPALPTAGRERASSFQETQRHFWKRNKGFYSWQWRMAWASLHLCDKGVHALEFPLSLFSGCKVLLRSSKWCVYRRTSKHVGRSQSRHVRRNSIFLTQGTHFALIKLKKKKTFSQVLSKLSLHKVLGSLLGKVPSWLILHTPKKEKYVWGQSTKVHFGSAVFVRKRLWAKEGCEYDWSFPFSKKRILRNLTGQEKLSSFLGHGA